VAVRAELASRVEQILSASLTRYAAWLVVAVACGSFIPRIYLRMADGNDLSVYLGSARALVQGGNPYSKGDVPQGHGPYPLTVDALITPLTWVPLWAAEAIWFGISLAALVCALAILDRAWEGAGRDGSLTLRISFAVRLAALVLVLFVPLQSHFSFGQLDLVILLVCCLFVAAQAGGREGSASMWLGGGIALKLTPSVFVVDLVAGRRIRALLLTGAWILVWALLVPTLVSTHAVTLYRGWWLDGLRHHLESPVGVTWRTRFSLAGMLVRLWPRLGAVTGLHYAVAAAVLAPLVALRITPDRDPRKHLTLFALYLTTIPLLSPISEMHHLTLIIGTLWLWLLAAGSPPRMPVFDAVGGLLFLALHWLGVAWNHTLPGFAPSPPTGLRRTGSLFEGGALVALYAVLLVRAHAARRRDDSGRP
jgi:alpha-1,2-mannosyltransferase